MGDDKVFSMGIDNLGYIWFEHVNSLSRYDGYNFTVIKHDEQDPCRREFVMGELNSDYQVGSI